MRITFEPVPRAYELSWSSKDRALELHVRHEFLAEVFKASEISKWRMADHAQAQLGLGELTADPEIGFGFSPYGLMRQGSKGDFAVFSLHLPRIEEGRGKSREYKHERGIAAAWAFSLLLMRLEFVVGGSKIQITDKQLVTVEVAVAGRSMHGFPLWGACSVEMVRWLSSQPQQQPIVATAMNEAFVRMNPTWCDSDFYVAVTPGTGVFHMRVPGNCACLGVEGGSHDCLKEGQGYCFESHNVDSPAQQLALLAGVAALWEQARNQLYAVT